MAGLRHDYSVSIWLAALNYCLVIVSSIGVLVTYQIENLWKSEIINKIQFAIQMLLRLTIAIQMGHARHLTMLFKFFILRSLMLVPLITN